MTQPPSEDPETPPASEPYRAALGARDASELRLVLKALGDEPGRRSKGLAEEIAQKLAEPETLDGLIEALEPPSRLVIALFQRAESSSLPYLVYHGALAGLGLDEAAAAAPLFEQGLIAMTPVEPARSVVALHPAVLEREPPKELERIKPPPAVEGEVKLVRRADGLEPILRLAVLWQRVAAGPLKRTKRRSLHKRDWQRLEEDATLGGPIADAPRPIEPPLPLWLGLGIASGLLVETSDGEGLEAAPADFWSEHGVHLPALISSRWLAGWEQRPETGGRWTEEHGFRLAALLRLSRLHEEEWTTLDDLAAALGRPEATDRLADAMLGPAYQLDLIQTGELAPAGRRVVRLSPRGRFQLGLGPPAPPAPPIPQFLFVQPNFEIVAYRQGLNPPLIGRLSRFAWWERIGPASTLVLTPESIYRGLESGLSGEAIRDWLASKAVRSLPDGVAGAIATWAGQRERLTYYAAATLIEFGSAEELEAALESWPEDSTPPPVRLNDRLLLIERETAIPFQRFRLAGSRDYRRPPEACVEVEPDGVTLSADPSRGDLFVEAEIAKFADPVPESDPLRRRFVASPVSIRRGLEEGLNTEALEDWFRRRTNEPTPPALRLLLGTVESSDVNGLTVDRPLVVRVPEPEWLDGLYQHPATKEMLGERLGPNAAEVRPAIHPSTLQTALEGLGIAITIEPDSS